jgi:hypothetical protein
MAQPGQKFLEGIRSQHPRIQNRPVRAQVGKDRLKGFEWRLGQDAFKPLLAGFGLGY